MQNRFYTIEEGQKYEIFPKIWLNFASSFIENSPAMSARKKPAQEVSCYEETLYKFNIKVYCHRRKIRNKLIALNQSLFLTLLKRYYSKKR